MTLQEFSELKAGDKIVNMAHGTTSRGEIVQTENSGVRVVWGPRHDSETKFFYSVVGTAWMHWTRDAASQL